MSGEGRKIEVIAAAVVALLALFSAIGTFILLPYRVSAAEAAIKQVQEQRASDHDLLLRIDARTEEMFRMLNRSDKKS